MQRRHFLFLAPLLPSALLAPRFLHARGRQVPPPHNLPDETLRLNELASNIHTVADARRFIDAMTELFADDLPPAWTTESLRNRLAQSEYLTVTDPHKRISEQHLAAAWNTYITAIDASTDSQVSAAEIHYLRDAHFTIARQMWDRGSRNLWLLPSIFAVQPDGTLAPACRLVESLRILYDLDRFPENLRTARENIAKGILASDLMKQAPQQSSSATGGRAYLQARSGTPQPGSTSDPAEAAARRKRAMKALSETIDSLLNSVLNT